VLSARPVQGTFRRLRWWADAVLIAILFAVPWIRIGGEPLVMLDVPGRKFHVFGLVIFPQELFFLWLIVIGLALTLFFFTALAGRLWCGWACPQTVFTDVFAAIARRVQGWKGHRPPARVARWRVALTHALWFSLSSIVAFHLVGYFVSPYAMFSDLAAGVIHPAALGFLAVVTGITYLDFGFVKQTFCKYLCPYARFQGVLFDRDTLVIGYDALRGEPRGKASRAGVGDCVDCGLCVAVCPTGIDIRKGLQLECIACTQCIDACDGVMKRLGRRRGLIDYRSLVGLLGERSARLLRPRVALYGALLVAVAVTFGAMLAERVPMELYVTHNGASLFGTAADGRPSNAFTLHIENRDRSARSFRIALGEGPSFELLAGVNPISVPAVSTVEAKVFVLSDDRSARSQGFDFLLEPVDGRDPPLVRKARFVAREHREADEHDEHDPHHEQDGHDRED
jgi:cytochrome c oxidase accessory protein FixG